ncbi:hypothetical protein SLEP1_g50412 [Rubroshorea leprosula]|uniref:Uncharacterized protein n=1 Tax=Rubroshorea leprosula TaxID=152421 RepID=A0AAV5M320_9ROSI|nr:hypothetical protein SLEP1_g50412 [Rubroshorea leprosula]
MNWISSEPCAFVGPIHECTASVVSRIRVLGCDKMLAPPQVLAIFAFRASILGGIVSLTHNFLVLSHHHLLETLNTCCCKPTRRGTKTKDVGKLRGVMS